jgi:hypothetical protein
MKVGKALVMGGLAALSIAGGLTVAVVSAPPASAGCLAVDPDNTYCDAPVAPDGTWNRCHENAGQIVYQNGWVFKRMPPTKFCYQVDPSKGWPPERAAQPQFHVD